MNTKTDEATKGVKRKKDKEGVQEQPENSVVQIEPEQKRRKKHNPLRENMFDNNF